MAKQLPHVVNAIRMILLVISADAVSLSADNWPMHLHDPQRTGVSAESLSLPLQLEWTYRMPHPPEPAWPEPAMQDYWNRKTNLRPRIVFDRASGVVAAGDRVIFGTSSDDQVRALDARDGTVLWTFFAEGPIRLAPTLWNGLVLFGSDDGRVYALDERRGTLQWSLHAEEIGPARIPGNGRVISARPIRSDVFVHDGTGYFTAGIFPRYGAHFFSFDPRTGKLLDRAPLDKSVQGYLEQRDGRIFAATGGDHQGAVVQGEPVAIGRNLVADSDEGDVEVLTRIADANHQFVGRTNSVAALNSDGSEAWSAAVTGRAYCLAIADGRLLVSTDQGEISAFTLLTDPGKSTKGRDPNRGDHHPLEAVTAEKDSAAATDLHLDLADWPGAASAVEANGHSPSSVAMNNALQQFKDQPGYALLVEPAPSLVSRVLSFSRFRVVATVAKRENAAAIRDWCVKNDVANRVAVHVHPPDERLPYGDHIFNLVIGGQPEMAKRLARPFGGVAICDGAQLTPDVPENVGSWTHTYGSPGNTASTLDHVGGDLELQWFGGPGPRNMVDRHMRTTPPLAHRAQLFIPGLDRIITVDAFNGTLQWERDFPRSTRIGILKDCGWLAVDDEHLWVAYRGGCVGVDVGSGTTEFELAVPTANRDWGYVACINGLVVGSTTLVDASRRTINRDAILEGAYSDNRPIVCSDGVFAYDAMSRQLRWEWATSGAMLNPSIASNGRLLFFLEATQCKLESAKSGRVPLRDFLDSGAKLVALDLATGEPRWSRPVDGAEGVQNAFVLCDESRVFLVRSRNDGTVHYDVRALSALDGKELWTESQDNGVRIGGDHGEQDKHPVLVHGRLIVEPVVYDVANGQVISDMNLSGRGYGCGTLSASQSAIFFRSGNPAQFRFDTKVIEPVTSVTRPGCWINMVPASGLLLIPEGSAGCTCSFPVQTSLAFRARK